VPRVRTICRIDARPNAAAAAAVAALCSGAAACGVVA
jgi:hypothetical protein